MVVPPATSTAPVSGSRVHSWWVPAIAIQTRSPHHATSHGEDRREVSSPGIHWVPSPASVRTEPSSRRSPATRCPTVSATTTSYPTATATSAGSRHSPLGSLNPPMRRTTSPSAESSTTSSCPASATSTPPDPAIDPDSGTAEAGKRRSVGSTTGGTYGESPGCRVPRSRWTGTSSASRAAIAWACPSPAYCATT